MAEIDSDMNLIMNMLLTKLTVKQTLLEDRDKQLGIWREWTIYFWVNYESGSYFHWVIEWKETGELVGTINLGNVEESCMMSDTCYMLSPRFWNQGIMTEVLMAVLDYAFEEIGLNRVQAEVFAGNNASSAVLKKCGMSFEGIARQKYYKNGEFIDTALWAIIASDRMR